MLVELPTCSSLNCFVSIDKIEYIRYQGGGESLIIFTGREYGECLRIPLKPSEIAAKIAKVESKAVGGKK